MIEIKIDDEIYTERQFKRDLTRFFDTYRDKNSEYMGSSSCNDVVCMDCPLHEDISVCSVSKAESFDLIKFVYDWAQKHPIVTNLDKLKELFGLWIEPTIVIGSEDEDEDDDENENPFNFEFLFMKTGDYTILTHLEEKDDTFWNWLHEEYKEPKGGKDNG